MKRTLLALAAALLATSASAQTQFPANTLWGNTAAATGLPTTVTLPGCTGGNVLTYTAGSGFTCVAGGGGGGAVSSVSNSDSTLTFSPTTGAVIGSLNLAHANTWTAAQTLSGLTLSGITGSTQCLQVNSSGVVSGTASACGSGGGGTNLLPLNNVWTGTNNFTLNTGMGANVAPDALLTVNANTAAASVAPPVGTALHMVGADAASPFFIFDTYGGNAVFFARRADGTNASKNSVAANSNLFAISAQGWDGGTYGGADAALRFTTDELFDATHHGARIGFFTTASGGGSAPLNEVLRIQSSGGLSVGSANVGTDPGNGNIRATGYYAGATAGVSCASGVTAATVVVVNGIVTHC